LNLTIVIPTRDRPEQVRRLVRELNGVNYEIIVVADPQQAVVVSGARVISTPPRIGSGESRNIGGREANHDWLLFIDDDHFPSPGLSRFIDRLLPGLKPRDIIGFRVVGSNDMGSSTIKYRYTGVFRMLNILFGVDISPHSGPSRFVPVAMIFPSRFFASLGGFDSRTYRGNGFREESDLQWRARKMGGRIIYVEEPFFLHLNIPGGHNKRHSENDVYYMRNQTIFALRTGNFASLIMIAGFAVYLITKGIRVSTLVRGIAQGVATVLQG